MYKFAFILGVILGFCSICDWSWAEKAYVTDSFRITFRTGPSLENKITAMLSSGQPVEVLGSHGDWSHVRLLENGESTTEGWVLSRFLITRQPWEMRASALVKENTQLKEKLRPFEKKLSEADLREKELATKLEETAKALHELEKEYESLKKGSVSYLKLKATHAATQSKLELIQKEFEELTEKYQRTRSSQRNRWFATGAGVLLFGLIIGLVLGRQQRKRRSSYY